jgi:hypothetical protein
MKLEELQSFINHGTSLMPDVDEYVSSIAFGTYSQCRQRRELHKRVKDDYNNAAFAFTNKTFWGMPDHLAELGAEMCMTAVLALQCLDAHDEQSNPFYNKCLDYILLWSSMYAGIAVRRMDGMIPL